MYRYCNGSNLSNYLGRGVRVPGGPQGSFRYTAHLDTHTYHNGNRDTGQRCRFFNDLSVPTTLISVCVWLEIPANLLHVKWTQKHKDNRYRTGSVMRQTRGQGELMEDVVWSVRQSAGFFSLRVPNRQTG